jgi:hypothetical protein
MIKHHMLGALAVLASLSTSACDSADDGMSNAAMNYTDDALTANDVSALDAFNGTDANLAVEPDDGTDALTDSSDTSDEGGPEGASGKERPLGNGL